MEPTHLHFEKWTVFLCRALRSNRGNRSGYGSGMQTPPFYARRVYHRPQQQELHAQVALSQSACPPLRDHWCMPHHLVLTLLGL